MFDYLKKCIFSDKETQSPTQRILEEGAFHCLPEAWESNKSGVSTACGLVRGFLATARKSLNYRMAESRVLHSVSELNLQTMDKEAGSEEQSEKQLKRKASIKAKLLEKASCYKALCDMPVMDLDGEAMELLRRKSRILLKLYLEEELYKLLVWTGGKPVLTPLEFEELMQSRGGMEVFWPSLLKVTVLQYLLKHGRLHDLAQKYRELSYLRDGSDERSVRRVVTAFLEERNLFELEWDVYGLFSAETKHFVFFAMPLEFRCGLSPIEACKRRERHLPKEIANYISELIEQDLAWETRDDSAGWTLSA